MQKNVHIPQQNGGAAERDYIIRPIRPKECADAFNLLATNGEWNLTLIKFKKVVEVFPSNIFVMIKRGTQEVVATCSATPTFPGQCVLGNLVVRLDHRSRGLGKSMCLHMTDIVQRIRSSTATLTAVPGVALFYSNLGFQTIQPSHYVNFVTVDRARVHKACSGRNLDNNNIVISNYTPDMFQALNRYDTQARGYDCGKYLSVMTHASDTFVIATRRDSDQVVVVGYAAGVLELSYLLVDGLYADDDDIALHLYIANYSTCTQTKK